MAGGGYADRRPAAYPELGYIGISYLPYRLVFLSNKFKSKPLLLQGAMGTQLLKKGVKLPLPLWSASANIDDRETVMEIHKDYLNAGADIITTNTFRTTTYTYHKAGFSMQEAKTMARESLLSAVESARMIGLVILGSFKIDPAVGLSPVQIRKLNEPNQTLTWWLLDLLAEVDA